MRDRFDEAAESMIRAHRFHSGEGVALFDGDEAIAGLDYLLSFATDDATAIRKYRERIAAALRAEHERGRASGIEDAACIFDEEAEQARIEREGSDDSEERSILRADRSTAESYAKRIRALLTTPPATDPRDARIAELTAALREACTGASRMICALGWYQHRMVDEAAIARLRAVAEGKADG